MDTLIIFQNYTEFRHIVSLLHTNLKHFDFDVNVSLFETTIRLLGGLLSAHLMAIDPLLHIYVSFSIPFLPFGSLLLMFVYIMMLFLSQLME